MAKIYGVASQPRPGKTVYIGACHRFMDDGEGNLEPWRIVFELTARTITAKGEQLLLPEIEADTKCNAGDCGLYYRTSCIWHVNILNEAISIF